jgi:ELWxxDGT repeat protein
VCGTSELAFYLLRFEEYVTMALQVIFQATEVSTGTEPWITDGTPEGTILLKDIWPGANSSSASGFTVFGNKVVFQANNETNGVELWITDGTPDGTALLKDIWLGSNGSSLGGFTVLGDKLVFRANDGTTGTELWVTDGTTAGTLPLKDIWPGSGVSNPQSFTVLGNKLVFLANDPTNGQELWVTDGTEAGTVLLKDINAGTNNSSAGNFSVLGDKLVFTAFDSQNGTELWITDGTSDGTVLLKDINAGGLSSFASGFTVFGNKLVFRGSDSTNGTELWVTDGSAAGTVRLKDIWPGTSSSVPEAFTLLGNKLVFRAGDPTNGQELWVTDGTPAGTLLLRDINVGAGGSSPSNFTILGDRLVFRAIDGTNGEELWITDGTQAGTLLLKDIRAGFASSGPSTFTVLGNKLVFTANDGTNGLEIWVTDGTQAGTLLLKDIRAGAVGSSPSTFTVVGEKLYFSALDPVNGQELWVTDGTPDGTALLKDIRPGPNSSSLSGFTVLGDKLVFRANDGTTGSELWVTDGTTAGTMLLADINQTTGSSNPTSFTVAFDLSFTPPNTPPVVTAASQTLAKNAVVAAASLFQVTDADSDPIQYYQFFDNGRAAWSGVFLLDGVPQATGQEILVAAADLASFSFRVASAGSDDIYVRAFDGEDWSEWAGFTISTPTNTAPVVSAGNQALAKNAVVAASSLFQVTDAESDAIQYYQFFDNGRAAESGVFLLDGVPQATGQEILVAAADLASFSFRAASAGSDNLFMRVFDGAEWSDWTGFTISTTNTAPVVTAENQTLTKGETVAASSLFEVTDAETDAIQYYQFFDNGRGAGSGVFLLDGVTQATGQEILVAAADLASLSFRAASAGSDDLYVRAFDGANWSEWTGFTISTSNSAPVITANNQTLPKGDVVAASELFEVTDADSDAILYYQVFDNGRGAESGVFILDGLTQATGQEIFVDAADLASLEFQVAESGSDDLYVRAFDGANWSDWTGFTVTASDEPGI